MFPVSDVSDKFLIRSRYLSMLLQQNLRGIQQVSVDSTPYVAEYGVYNCTFCMGVAEALLTNAAMRLINVSSAAVLA